MKTNLNPNDQLLKSFERLSRKQSRYEAFCKMLDFGLLFMNAYYDRASYDDFVSKLDTDEISQLTEIILTLSDVASGPDNKGFRDPFGDLFMEVLSDKYKGQFFTPESLCIMKAQMIIPNLKDGQSVCDPACGSGRTLLAAAAINRNAIFYGADIDILCVKMTVINFMLNSMTGEVAHMDTLSLKHYASYQTGTVLFGKMRLPYFRMISSEESVLAQKPPISVPKSDVKLPSDNNMLFGNSDQLSLF